MLSASLLRQRRPSVRLSVCLSVTLLYCAKTTQLRIMKSSLWATARTSFFATNFRAAGWGDSPRTRASNKGTPVKSRHFTAIGSSSVKTVADRHRLAAHLNKHCWRAFQRYQHRWPWMTLNPQNRGFSDFFTILGCGTHFKSELCRNGWT